jgi:hypothetical protein
MLGCGLDVDVYAAVIRFVADALSTFLVVQHSGLELRVGCKG